MTHRWNAGMALIGAVALGVVCSWEPRRPRPIEEAQAPVPLQEWTTDAGAAFRGISAALPGKLPSPGPNQKRAGACDPEQAQVELNGGCWLQTTTPPPCPRGKQWEHDGRCWLPVAHAKAPPTSGEPTRPGGVAGP